MACQGKCNWFHIFKLLLTFKYPATQKWQLEMRESRWDSNFTTLKNILGYRLYGQNVLHISHIFSDIRSNLAVTVSLSG